MHKAMGMEYPFPDLLLADGTDNPLFLRMLVVEEEGQVKMAMLARVTSEGYLLQDKQAAPETRWDMFRELQAEMLRELYEAGLEDVHVFLPPQVAKGFSKRLKSLGWIGEPWAPFCKFLEAPREVAIDGQRR